MNLTEKNLSSRLSNYQEICQWMKRVFPKEELMPMWLIKLLILKKNYNFKVYYHGPLFVGILFTIQSEDTVFVFYIAVNDKIHSKGYGSELLRVLFNQFPDKSVTLFIETVSDKEALNYDQRIKRLAFYERNGFVHTKIEAGFKKPFVDILSTDKDFDVVKAKKLMRFFPMKIFVPQRDSNAITDGDSYDG